jgi:hypothetical protein
MTVTIIKNIDFKQCLTVYASKLKDKNNLSHYKDFVKLMSEGRTTALIVNHQYYSLDELREKIIERSHSVADYFLSSCKQILHLFYSRL